MKRPKLQYYQTKAFHHFDINAYTKAQDEFIDQILKENQILRQFMWINHGCEISALYGDDGEMQCNKCRIDFKRQPVEEIHRQFMDKKWEIIKDAGLDKKLEKWD